MSIDILGAALFTVIYVGFYAVSVNGVRLAVRRYGWTYSILFALGFATIILALAIGSTWAEVVRS